MKIEVNLLPPTGLHRKPLTRVSYDKDGFALVTGLMGSVVSFLALLWGVVMVIESLPPKVIAGIFIVLAAQVWLGVAVRRVERSFVTTLTVNRN